MSRADLDAQRKAMESARNALAWVDRRNTVYGKQQFISAAIVALDAAIAAQAPIQGEPNLESLLPGTYYMDPPDGGSITPYEQCQRMGEDAARYRYLRDEDWKSKPSMYEGGREYLTIGNYGEQLDAVIDAARKAVT